MQIIGKIFYRSLFQFIFVLALLIISGCSSVPMATEQEDQAAKQFQPSPNSALIFVFRDQAFVGAALTIPLFLDGKLVAGINDFTFCKLDVAAGTHELSSSGSAFAKLSIQTEASQIYFVRLTARPRILLVNADEGQRQVQKCKLVQP